MYHLIYIMNNSNENPNHWLIRTGDAIQFKILSKNKLTLFKSNIASKNFENNVKENDILWFVKRGGVVIAVSTFKKIAIRELGPLIAVTPTNEDFEINKDSIWDKEIHYDNLYNITDCDLKLIFPGQNTFHKFKKDKHSINLENEYQYIVKYSKIKNKM